MAARLKGRMQKSLGQVNVRVHRAVSDIGGQTGMAILRAIAEGERDARQERIAEYERETLRKLTEMEREECRGQEPPKSSSPRKTKAIRKRGEEPLRAALDRIGGVELTAIDATGVETVQVVLGEYGPGLSRFPTEKQFVSHATLAPSKAASGGKPVKKKKRGTARRRWGLTIAGLRGGWEATPRYLQPPGSWPL